MTFSPEALALCTHTNSLSAFILFLDHLTMSGRIRCMRCFAIGDLHLGLSDRTVLCSLCRIADGQVGPCALDCPHACHQYCAVCEEPLDQLEDDPRMMHGHRVHQACFEASRL